MNLESSVKAERSGSVLTVIINRPHKRNAINTQTAELLHRTFVDFENDPDLDVAVLSGAGGGYRQHKRRLLRNRGRNCDAGR